MELRALADAACLDGLHDLLARVWASAPDVDELDRMRLATALGEIVGNVVGHGVRADGGRPDVTVTIAVDDATVTAVVLDDGIAVPGADEDPPEVDEDAESGRGFALARAALDELDYARDGDVNRWRLVVRRGAGLPA